MALSNTDFLKHLKEGTIIVDPFRKEDLATSSYDLRLGEWYYKEQRPEIGLKRLSIFNPFNENDVARVWGKLQRAKPLKDVFPEMCDDIFSELEEGISPNDLIIPIEPMETLLAHTDEFIGGIAGELHAITTSMQTRSSHGRSFIGVCKCAGWGDVGYINRWTMEITNFSRFYTIPLVVGRRYAQMIFDEMSPITTEGYGKNGKYQSGHNILEIKANWKPEMMLPKLYLDRDRERK